MMLDDHEQTEISTSPNYQSHVTNQDALVQIYPAGLNMGKKWALGRGKVYVGRDSTCEIVIQKKAVSRKHARFTYEEGTRYLEDLNSTNGSFVNNRMVDKSALNQGDQVKIGDTIFKYLVGNDVESAYHEEIYRMTIIDGLTGIYNKRYFMDEITRETTRTARYHRPLTLLMLDIDNFKIINDTWGHLAGDLVLQQMSSAIGKRTRRDSIFCRYGGEEFAILVPECKRKEATLFAEQIRKLVEDERFMYENERIPVTVSVGVAAIENHTLTPEAFIDLADKQLYRAKELGRNIICC